MNMERCRAWINETNAANNFYQLRDMTDPHVKFLCVVKANAYGHGASQMAKLWERLGADMLGVASAEEALFLVNDGVRCPILVLGYADTGYAAAFFKHNILPTIYSLENAKDWNRAAERHGICLPCHIKINTGMNRLGIPYDKRAHVNEVLSLPHLRPCGIYSHFAAADTSPAFTELQLSRFANCAQFAEACIMRPLIKHIANTDAFIRDKRTHLDMVRTGIGLYGYSSCNTIHLIPALTLEAKVVQIHHLARGENIGYGGDCHTHAPSHIATLAIGYADGLPRNIAVHGGAVLLHGEICPLIGRCCMDMCMADISALKTPVKVDEYATVIDGKSGLGADKIATQTGTIPYEILSSLASRITRKHIR